MTRCLPTGWFVNYRSGSVMMTTHRFCGSLQPPLRPRNGRTLRVLLPGRVSDLRPGKQDRRSLEDQEDIQRRWLPQHTDLPVRIMVISGSGSGEILGRDEYQRLLRLIQSEEYDLVLTEDLGRIVRRVHAFFVCELCEDHHVRLIAINNYGVDTAQPGWRDAAFFAAYFYEKENRDKSIRLKERLRSRFLAGGALPAEIFGYIRPPGAKTDRELRKDPDAEPVYKEWFRRLDEEEALYADIADWLNSEGIPTGPSCRERSEWDGPLVSQTTHNPILKGLRYHSKRKTRRINASGKYKSEKAAPEDLLTRRVPHLAFCDEAYYDRVVAAADARNAKYRRNGEAQRDPRANVPKKRTRFPGQLIECGICGRLYVFGGHGQKDHLMCSGAREHKCWNGITVDGPLAAKKISESVFAELEALEGFDPTFLEMVEEQARKANEGRAKKLRDLSADIARNERELANVAKFIREGGSSPTIRADLERLDSEKLQLRYELKDLESRPVDDLVIPTAEELRQLAREEFKDLALDSFEFAKLMRCLIPKIVVWPYRLCDGGHIVLRSQFRLYLAGLLPDPRAREVLAEPLDRVLTVDLFDPPQRAEFRERIVALRATVNPETGKKYTEAEAAREVGITKTATQRAAALQRRMDQLGLSDPFVRLLEPPDDYTKLRRHKHKRYSFEPLDGAGQL